MWHAIKISRQDLFSTQLEPVVLWQGSHQGDKVENLLKQMLHIHVKIDI